MNSLMSDISLQIKKKAGLSVKELDSHRVTVSVSSDMSLLRESGEDYIKALHAAKLLDKMTLALESHFKTDHYVSNNNRMFVSNMTLNMINNTQKTAIQSQDLARQRFMAAQAAPTDFKSSEFGMFNRGRKMLNYQDNMALGMQIEPINVIEKMHKKKNNWKLQLREEVDSWLTIDIETN